MPLSNPIPVLAGTGITKTGYTVAVDQSFAPTWTGLHKFDANIGATANLTIAPVGDIILDPTGNDVLPNTGYDINLGSLAKKFLTLHAAELWVETLVAQSTIATIGGRVLVGPTTSLTRDLTNVATTIYVKHNQMASGDRAYMEANSKVEFMSVDSAPTLEAAGDYSYTVTRNLDATGANEWNAGDAVFNTGTTGDGFLDLYSVSGIKAGTGPTIAGQVRNSATYNDWSEHFAVGNLNGLYGYATDIYGAAFGKFAASMPWISIDATNGLRINQGTTPLVLGQWDASGNITIGDTANEHIAVSGTAIDFKDGTTNYGKMSLGAFRIGRLGAGYSNMFAQAAGGLQLRTNTTVKLDLQADGDMFAGTNTAAAATTHLAFFNDAQVYNTESMPAGSLLLGDNSAAQANLLLASTGIQFRTGQTVKIDLQSDGDVFIGENTGAAATTNLAFFTNEQTYNGELIGAGDVLIGDNTASKANILWDKSTGRIHFRGGTTSYTYLDTDGTISAASGNVVLNSGGIEVGFSGYLAIGGGPAQSGTIRLSNNQWINARNQANSADLSVLQITTGDKLSFGIDVATAINITTTGYFAVGTNPAQSGTMRLPNNGWLVGRNAANAADINLMQLTTGDVISFGANISAGITVTASGFISTGYTALGANPAQSGTVRLGNAAWVMGRNAANSADLELMGLDGTNVLTFPTPLLFQGASDSATFVQVKKSDGTVVFTIDTTNTRVGIGSDLPTGNDKLQLRQCGDAQGILISGNSTDAATVGFYIDNNYGGRMYSLKSTGTGAGPGAGMLVVKDEDDNATRWKIDSNGRCSYNIAGSDAPRALIDGKETYRLGSSPADGYAAGLYLEPIYNNSSVASVTVVAGGSGYALNDVLTLTQSNFSGTDFTACTVTVDGVSAGVVTSVALTTNGRGYTTGTKNTTVAPAGGTGCTINVASLTAHTVTRHNYLTLLDTTGTGTVTDSAVFRLDAALGTHKATTATDKTGNTKSGTLKVNIAGTLYHIQLYAN